MRLLGKQLRLRQCWFWLVGFALFLWVLFRSGVNPKRLTYPCQRVAVPIAVNWLLAVVAFFCGSLLLRRFLKLSCVAIAIVGAVWFVGALPELSRSDVRSVASLPVWEVGAPASKVFVMDSIPTTTGSLAAGNASVPDAHLPDPAIDTLLAVMETRGIFLHQTALHPSGVVGADNVVIIKGNFQWPYRNTTNTDRIKGLIWQVLQHPNGFSGEIIVCDNTQEFGTLIGHNDNNSEDTAQSIIDVVNTFNAKGYPVYLEDWSFLWSEVVSEYSQGDYNDGYTYEPATKISYPKFRSPSGNHYISLRYGIWNPASPAYDASRLCIISFPVLKGHAWAGATIAVKNWVGVLTTAYKNERYAGHGPMHDVYFVGSYALVARVMAVTLPRLSIVDATWTATSGPDDRNVWVNTKMLLASADPVAVSWYAAKFILTPIASHPDQTNPDLPGSAYSSCLGSWTTYLVGVAGLPCTRDSANMSVYDRTALGPGPEVPILIEPPHLAVINDDTPTFDWSATAGSGGAYTLEYATDSLFLVSLTVDGIGDTTYELPALLAERDYYWHVNAIDAAGNESGYQSAAFMFTVDLGGVPAIPDLLTPPDSSFSCDTTPTFSWTSVAPVTTSVAGDRGNISAAAAAPTAVTYTLQYGADPAFAGATTVADIPDATYTVSGLALSDTICYWRVEAVDGINHSGYQDHPFQFGLFVAGDQDGDGVLTSSDIIYLVNYVFKAGPAPLPCVAAGDANCNGVVTSADIIYLVNYTFKGGLPPCNVGDLIADGRWSCP